MPRDRDLVKRNLFAIPGALLAFYASLGLLYILAYREPTGICKDASRFLVAGACYGSLPFLTLFLIAGLVLLTLGLTLFRGRVTRLDGYLQPGTPTIVLLSLLASCAVVPIITAAILSYVQGTEHITFATQIGKILVKTTFLLWVAAAAALTALVPSLLLAISQDKRRRRFLREARIVAATPPSEAAESAEAEAQAPAEAPTTTPLGDTAPPEEFVDEALWPNSRQ